MIISALATVSVKHRALTTKYNIKLAEEKLRLSNIAMRELVTEFLYDDHSNWHLTLPNRINAKEELDSILEEAKKQKVSVLVIDLVSLETIDSRGLGILLDVNKKFSEHNIDIELRNANQRLQRLFRIMQFDRIFLIKPYVYQKNQSTQLK